MLLLIKNANVLAPKAIGMKDILVGGGKILAIENSIESHSTFQIWDAQGKTLTPGLIDQHQHITGAGGKHGFHSLTPEISATELVATGTTTVVGLTGTDGATKSIKTLYAKTKALELQGLSAYMFTGYYGLDPNYIMDSVQDDMIFIDKVIGCKIAISDIRSSYPTDIELLRILREVMVGGMIGRKKGILHFHLGILNTKMDQLFRLVQEHDFPIKHISPTHVGRNVELFDQAIEFAKLGGMIDITTGASKYTDPYKMVLHALDKNAPISNITFSTDGNAGLDKKDENGNLIGFRRAPITTNLSETVALIKQGGLDPELAIKLITSNPAKNLGLAHKGNISLGADADFCAFDSDWKLTDVFALGKQWMRDQENLMKPLFD
ncbi:MAG: beta-aspartyl-peptidase [Salibacteraceae bacterium]|nr:beta-aspartyl-peptidase [Salibacteraceae bacterium]MDP4762772.1 beta-aspartyl-peptidase [Salibacteraceae bacterium]MDP4964051.1 beta-aspartyl-peptidase [Salibacteraceae bacterium]